MWSSRRCPSKPFPPHSGKSLRPRILRCWRRRMTRLANGKFGVTRRYSCPTTRWLTHSPYGLVCRAPPTIACNSPSTSWRSACRGKGTLFQSHFARYADQYVLIGGTAATLAMEEAGLEFRATKDLDIVLHIEALNDEFATAFWAFVEQGEYEIRRASKTGKPVLYRFQKPKNERFPAMLELFCRSPDGMVLAAGSQLTPIPIEDETASLSAILLDDAYYAFI